MISSQLHDKTGSHLQYIALCKSTYRRFPAVHSFAQKYIQEVILASQLEHDPLTGIQNPDTPGFNMKKYVSQVHRTDISIERSKHVKP